MVIRSALLSLICSLALAIAFSGTARADVVRELAALYPEQSSAVLMQRIAQVDSKEMFFKSFAPYFYSHVRSDVLSQSNWGGIARHQSWCVGDGHPDNFGVLLSNDGLPLFSVNDVDDASPCILAADLLRFFTGWALLTEADPVNALMPAYLRGLRGELMPTPNAVLKILNDGRQAGLAPKAKWMNSHGDFKNRKDLKDVPVVLDPELRRAAGQTAGSGWSVQSLRERVNFSGGSGGLHRYLVLLRDGGGRLVLLEFKEIARAATFPLGGRDVDPVTRMRTAWNLEQGPVVGNWLSVVNLAGRPFFTRPLWDGNLNLKLKKMTPKQQGEFAMYEANVLGTIHHRGGAPADYANDVVAMGAAWSQTTDNLRQTIKAAYKELPNVGH